MEPLLVWALVAVALALAVLLGRSLVLGALIVAAVAAGQLLWTAPAAPAANLPKPRSEGGYVTSDACRVFRVPELAPQLSPHHAASARARAQGRSRPPATRPRRAPARPPQRWDGRAEVLDAETDNWPEPSAGSGADAILG